MFSERGRGERGEGGGKTQGGRERRVKGRTSDGVHLCQFAIVPRVCRTLYGFRHVVVSWVVEDYIVGRSSDEGG